MAWTGQAHEDKKAMAVTTSAWMLPAIAWPYIKLGTMAGILGFTALL
jgi:hypothetical protein